MLVSKKEKCYVQFPAGLLVQLAKAPHRYFAEYRPSGKPECFQAFIKQLHKLHLWIYYKL